MNRYLWMMLMVANLVMVSEYCVKNVEINTGFYIDQGLAEYSLDLKGDSSIIVIVLPVAPEKEDTYVIELFKNGIIETTRGEGDYNIYYEDFTGDKEGVFKKIIERKQKILNAEEVEMINAISNRLDLNKVKKEYLERCVVDDIASRIVWINKRAYYYYSGKKKASSDPIPELIEEIIEYSPIEVDVRLSAWQSYHG